MTDLHDAPSYPYRRTCPYDPPPELGAWHAVSPLTRIRLWDGRPAWLVTGLDEVRQVLRDHQRFSSLPSAPGYPTLTAVDAASKGSTLLPMTDPPEHDVMRRAVQREFSVRRVDEKRIETEAIVRDLLDELAADRPPIDLVTTYAAAVPAQFTCRLLGVPLEDAPFFASCLSGRFDPAGEQTTVYAADDRLTDYFSGVVDDRLRASRDDLSGRLVDDYLRTDQLTHTQTAKLLHVLLIGGFDTTRNMIALGTMLFIDHPDRLAQLQAEPSRWGNAVEELLRYLSVAQYERRAVTEDVVIAGRQLKAGDGVVTVLHAANRDPRAFAEPDTFDVDRPSPNHVAFGSGIHQCLGQSVARMMLRVALPALFARFPTLRLAVPKEELTYSEGRTIWGPLALPVTW